MLRCHFHLRAGGKVLHDSIGSECRDLSHARAKARAVALDLMRNARANTRLWSLRVVDEQGEALFDLFFCDVDATVHGGWPHSLQQLTAATGRRLLALSEAIQDARRTVMESRVLRARAARKPIGL